LQWALPPGDTSQVVFSADSQVLMRAWDVLLDAWSVLTGKRVWEITTWIWTPTANWFVAVGPMAGWYATNEAPGVTIGNTSDTKVHLVIETGRTYQAMAFSPDGKTLATSGPALWRLADRQRIWPIAAPVKRDDLNSVDDWVAFSPNGSLLLVSDFTGGTSYITKLYRTSDGALVRDLGPSLSRRPNFSSDGAWIVAGSSVYPVLSGAPVILGRIPVDSVSTFAPDGTIAAGGTDGITRLFCPR
jgi:WD40 repeat protein